MVGAADTEHGPAMPAPDAIFGADGEVGRDLGRVDWAATPLGPPAGWPQSLRTAVSILLSSRFSMWMAWGPELTFFCNSAYRRDTLGQKYPWALGRPAREVWAEIWDDIGPRLQRVLSTGQATWDAALLLFLERSGYREETYHTFSYSPLRDDFGHVVGMLCVVSEDTDRVINERRMATLRDLGSDPSVVRTEQEMLAFTAAQLGHDPRDLPFTLTYLFDDRLFDEGSFDEGSFAGGAAARLAAVSGIAMGQPAAPTTLAADGSAVWPLEQAARGQSVLVELDGLFHQLPTGDWPDPPAQALVVPLPQQGAPPYGFLVAALNRYRRLDEGYRGFVELVAGHLSAGIASARSYQAQQQRAENLAELDRAKTTFFSNISHEFRTPLTLIIGPVAELRRRAPGLDEQAREELEVVHRNGLRLAKLVNTLLDFSRIEAGRMRAHYQPVDLAAVTADLASVFHSAVERAGLEFIVDCAPLDEPVYVDRDMWEKVVLNLLSNALKFTFEGSITVRVGRRDGDAVVTVSDTGVGCQQRRCPGCSSVSTASKPCRPDPTRAAESVWPWSRSWSGCLAAASPSTAAKVSVPLSPSGCRTARHTCPPARSPPTSPRRQFRRPRPTCRKRCGGCPLTLTPWWTPGPLGRPRTPSPLGRFQRVQPPGRECWLPTTTPTCGTT